MSGIAHEEIYCIFSQQDENCIRLNLMPLAMTVQEHALMWVQELGKLLNESAKENLFSLRDTLVSFLKKWYIMHAVLSFIFLALMSMVVNCQWRINPHFFDLSLILFL